MYWDIIKEQNEKARNPQLHIQKVEKADAVSLVSQTTRATGTRREPETGIDRKIWKYPAAAFAIAIAAAIAVSATVSAMSGGSGSADIPGAPDPVTAATFPLTAQDRLPNPNADNLQFSQTGEYWKVLGYWDSNVGYTGCGLCSYTTAIDIAANVDYTPLDMLSLRGDWAGMDNYTDDGTGLDGQTHGEFAKAMFGVDSYRVDVSIDALANELADGAAAVLCSHGDVFWDNEENLYDYDGHFVCAYKYDPDTGCFHVHDSAVSHALGNDVVYTPEQMAYMLDHTSSIVAYKAA